MVYLNRIYTKSGDEGQTGLGNGERVAKTHPRIRAFGAVDELNSALGVVLCETLPVQIGERLQAVQHDLFDIGADLCIPEAADDDDGEHDRHEHDDSGACVKPSEPLRIIAAQVETLEGWIDEATEKLQPLTSFILPGGSLSAARLHWARCVCRRAEIDVLQLAEFDVVNPQLVIYLNRLSDLLFVWARLCNNQGRDDILWVPGQNRPVQ